MEYEEKFLDPEYLSTRVRDFKEIKRGDLEFKVMRSCNYPESASLYIKFMRGNWIISELRVSDHSIKTEQTQFIVERGAILSKKKKEQFVRLVEKCIGAARRKILAQAMYKIGKKEV